MRIDSSFPYAYFSSQDEGEESLARNTPLELVGHDWYRTLVGYGAAFCPPQDRTRLSDLNREAGKTLSLCRAVFGPHLRVVWASAHRIYSSLLSTFPFMLEQLHHDLCSELALYVETDEKPYREHFAHPLYVFLAGKNVLDATPACDILCDKLFSEESIPRSFMARLPSRLGSGSHLFLQEGLPGVVGRPTGGQRSKVVRLAWILAAFLHDTGYPVFHLARRGRQVAGRTAPLYTICASDMTVGFRDFVEHSLLWQDLTCKLSGALGPSEVEARVFETLSHNHSVAAGMQILRFLYELLPTARAVRRGRELRLARPTEAIETVLAFEIAARAVALHDLDSPHKRGRVEGDLHFDREPMAVFLRFVDAIQEWDRPMVRRNLGVPGNDTLVRLFDGVLVKGDPANPAKLALDRILKANMAAKIDSGSGQPLFCSEAHRTWPRCSAEASPDVPDALRGLRKLACPNCHNKNLRAGRQGYFGHWQQDMAKLLASSCDASQNGRKWSDVVGSLLF